MHTYALARPLYLQNSSAKRLDIDQSGRLRIERQAHPDKYIPLHHVSRIVCTSNLDIGAKVWIACMQSGIPIAVTDKNGCTIGWCIGSRRKESSLKQLLMHALDDANWPELYRDWYGQQETAIAVHNLVMCGVATTAVARNNPRTALCNAHYLKHHSNCTYGLDNVAELAKHEMASALVTEVGAPELLAWYRPGLNLLDDLGRLVGLYAHTDIHHAGALPNAEQASHWSIRHYEKHGRHWQERIAHTLVAFEQFLRQHWQ